MGVEEKALGQRLAVARRQAGLTQQELCQKAGLSYSTLAKIERGAIRAPSIFTVATIAKVTNHSIEELLDMPSLGGSSVAKRTSKTGVKFVYFDINDTLVRHFQAGFTEAARELQVPVEDIENLFWRYNDDLCSAKLSTEDFNKKVAEQLGVKAFDWRKYYMANVEPMPGMEKLLRWTAQNYEVGLLSNNLKGFIGELISRQIIPDVGFKAVVDSCEVGSAKPDEKIYKLAQEKSGASASEILLVDDTRAFLTAADRLGWQITWFNEFEPAGSVKKLQKLLEY